MHLPNKSSASVSQVMAFVDPVVNPPSTKIIWPVIYSLASEAKNIKSRIPLNRPGQPNDLDGTVIFLASDASEYITGQIILVDGGFTTGATKAIT